MDITSCYWRQLYLYLSRQQRWRRQALRRLGLRLVIDTAFRPPRPNGSIHKRPHTPPA
jgi:hypothetical protein